jgi:type IV pilus assembly protein PilA
MITNVMNRSKSEEGFTLIELLVVILIIGILAAIAIPSFLNQRQKGQDACAKSMARTMQTAMETYYIDLNTYGGADVNALNAIENQVTTGACSVAASTATGTGTQSAGACTGGPGTGSGITGYCVTSTSASGNVFAITRNAASGAISRTCTVAGKGGCIVGGTW